MARKRKRKPEDGIDPKGKMRPAEGAKSPKDDEGTRIDDGARHVFFSFKGELKSGLPDATETDLAGNVGPRPDEDDTATSDPVGLEPTATEPDAAASRAQDEARADDDADATPADSDSLLPLGAPIVERPHPPMEPLPPEADAEPGAAQPPPAPVEPPPVAAPWPVPEGNAPETTPADADDTSFGADAATATELSPKASPRRRDHEQEQTRAGPVRGPDPAAEKTSASQSRKAAGPAHFMSPHESPLGDSSAGHLAGLSADSSAVAPSGAKAEAPAGAKADPAAPAPPVDPATHTDVRGEPFVPALGDATHTEIDAKLFAPGPKKPKTPPPGPPIVPTKGRVADDPTVGSETILDALAQPKKREVEPKSETILDTFVKPPPADATGDGEIGSATILDAEGVRGHDADAAPEGVTRTEPDGAAAPFAGPDAETVTKDPFATGTRATATDAARERTADEDAFAEATTGDVGPEATSSADAPASVSFHDADTASQDLFDVARETALPPASPFDLPTVDETQAVTGSRPDVPTVEVPVIAEAPAPFAGALFEAPEPTAQPERPPERPERPRLRSRRRGAKKPGEPLLKRVVSWAKRHLDPRDFLEIVGKGTLERARKFGERFRTERRENRVSHTTEWWRRTAVEIGILYAIVIPIELAVTGGRLGSFGVHPHPYWLVVLPLAAARGLVAGLLAAGIASILYAIGAAQSVTDAVFTFRNMTEPLLFFAVAFFAGELHDEGLLKRRKLDRRIKDLEERTDQLRQQRDVLTDANRELEKRIVDDSVQFGNLIQAARRIERAGRQEVFDLALEMAEEHCGAAASVLMLLDDGSLDYLCHRGFASDEIGKRLATARQSAFVQRAVAEGVAVNGLDPSEVAPQEGPLVVAPLFDAGGVVKALMCLDDIPLARLNESTVTVFLGIADWASAALARLTRGVDAPAPRAAALSVGPEVDLWLGTVPELGKRLRVELARSSRYGVPTSFLTIQATEWKDATREGIDALDRFVLMHFTTGLRPSDGIYRFGYPGTYLLVLAGTSLQGAEVVRTRLERRVTYTPSPFGTIEIRATGPDTEAPDLMSLIARCAKDFRERSRLPLEARTPVTVSERLEAEDLNTFLRRLKMETSLAVRNGLDLHVVGISAEASEKAGPGILARHVVEVGGQTLRPTDGVYMIGQYQCSVVLPCTNGEEAATVAHRLATLVRARDPSAPYGQIETQVLGLGPSHPDAGSFLTALARRGKETSR